MAVFGGDGVFRSGAPRPVKVGTIRSPWRYEEMRSTTRVTEGAKKPPNLLRICPFRLSQK
jgi:hypothetical protein